MGLLGKCVSCSAVSVACFAVVIGLCFAGVPNQLGFGKFIDRVNPRVKGILPFTHHDTPWGFNFDQMPSQEGKTILVTGANVGLGYWTTYHLAQKGAHVVMACRSQFKCQAALEKVQSDVPKASLEVLIMDLQSFASIKAASESFAGKHETLDSLVLNAGIMMTPFGLTKDGIEQQIGTNHFGHFLLSKLLRPVLVSTAAVSKTPPTIVAVSSSAHYDSYPEGVKATLAELNDEATYDPAAAYGQSKLANVLFAQELSEQLKADGVLVNSIHPGMVATELFRHVYDAIDKNFPAYAAEKASALVDTFFGNLAWKPDQAALTQLYTAVGPGVLSGKVTGKYFHPVARATIPSDHAQNKALQKTFWKLSDEVLAQKGY